MRVPVATVLGGPAEQWPHVNRRYSRWSCTPGGPPGTTVVSRTAVSGAAGAMWFEVTVMRRGDQVHPTFQGTVFLRDGSWIAEAASSSTTDLGRFNDFVDAENALVKRRTGVRSSQPWTGPRPRRCELCGITYVGECPKPSCGNCGHHLVHGICRRTDLHWTKESLAADETRRAPR